MPINEYGMNSDYVKFFSLEEYVDRIKLLPWLLEHLEDTNRDFDNYMKTLSKYDQEYIINHWIDSLYNELRHNHGIEHNKFNENSLVEKGIFFDTLNITHKRIHELHNFVVEEQMEPTFNYRKVPVNVSYYDEEGNEHIYWRGANTEDVNKFMTSFINLYKLNRTSLLFSNPFLVSSLMHLIFLRIHPYNDGNGRTARLIHNLKFTETINKLYGMKLKISPLNLSESINLNKITYTNRIDNIYFDLEHDTNDEINKWFDFILYMADEQLYRASESLKYTPEKYLIERPEIDIKKGSYGLKKGLNQK